MEKYIAYYRVSTNKQNYGLEAQQEVVNKWIINKGELINSYQEKISGKINLRPELEKAIEQCKKEDATLLIAKLDRLSRNVSFLFDLRDSGIKIACCDLPELNTLNLGIFATMAQHERELISKRTKEGLAVAKAKGKKLGGFRGSLKGIEAMKEVRTLKAQENDNNKKALKSISYFYFKEGIKNLSEIARKLNGQGIKTARGKNFQAVQVQILLSRLNLA